MSITQYSFNLNSHDKTKIFMLISVWINLKVSFIFIKGCMAKINTRRYFVPGFYWGIYGENCC